MKNNLPRLVKLLRENAERPRNYRIENAASDEATILMYDVIGMDFWTGEGITAKAFADAVSSTKATTIHLRMNSPGGDVFEARAIVAQMQAKQAQGVKFIGHVDGWAASAMSVVAVNCDSLEMAPGSFLMVHNAWTVAIGNQSDMEATAQLLAKIDGTIADDYSARSGATPAQAKAWMDAETWFTADEAVAVKMADTIGPDAPKNVAKWNLSAYENAPAAQTEPEPDTIEHDAKALREANERRLALIEQIA